MCDYFVINQVFPAFYQAIEKETAGGQTITIPPQAATDSEWATGSGGKQEEYLEGPIPNGNPALSLAQVSACDGTSNTVMCGECAGQPMSFLFGQLQTQAWVKVFGYGYPTANFGWGDPGGAYSINGCDGGAGPTHGAICVSSKKTVNGSTSSPGQVWNGTAYQNPVGPIVYINGNNNGEIYGFHQGGANVVMCDGSVHFLTSAISPSCFAALFTAQGSDSLDDTWRP
jgi:prepilin-type processing-associated H-X9-DG protein